MRKHIPISKFVVGLVLGALLFWGSVAVAQQTPTVTTMQNAATATGNGTPLSVAGPAANPANVIGAAGVQVTGTFSGTVTFETTTNGSTWTSVMATNLADDTRATTTTAPGQFTIILGSAVQVRARVSAYTSGSITVVGRLVPGLVARVSSSGGGGGGSPGGSSGDFQYNNGGSLGGATGVEYGSADETVLIQQQPGKATALSLVANGVTPSPPNASISPTLLHLLGASAIVTRDGLGTTNATGVELINNTAAAAGAQQRSPDFVQTAQGWKTTATAASQTVNFRQYVLPVQGTTAPTANWVLQSQINGGGYTDRLSVNSLSQVIFSGVIDYANPTITFAGDLNTGISWRAADLFSLVTSGIERLRIGTTIDALGNNIGASNGGQIALGTGGNIDGGLARVAAAVIRVTNSSTGAGSLVLGTSTVGSIGTSGVGVLAIANGTAPTTQPADEFQSYAADFNGGAGDSRAHIWGESGNPVAIGNNAIAIPTAAATTGASQTGRAISIVASPAVASTDTAGAAAGGSITFTAGAAARLTSGNANAGDYVFTDSAGVGTGRSSRLIIPDGTSAVPAWVFSSDQTTGAYRASSGQMGFVGNATERLRINAFGADGGSGNFSLGSSFGASDVNWGRGAASVFKLGNGSLNSGGGTISNPATSPAQLTADQNNYAPGVGWFQRWSSDASRNVTGLVAGVDGQIVEIWNVGSNNIVLQNENASSTAANRFATSTGADLTLSAGKCAKARYDTTSARWRAYLCN